MIKLREPIDVVVEKAGNLEPWQGYYMVRANEFKAVMDNFTIKKDERVLDIGSGNGFMAYLFSSLSAKVVATDLYSQNRSVHSIGIDKARDFFSRVGGGIPLVASSVEALPFKDETFDVIFSSYVLHYLNNKEQSLGEMRRITKTGGSVILVLPNFLERIYAFFQFYVYFFVKFVRLIMERLFDDKRKIVNSAIQIHCVDNLRNNYKNFPFPGPHGAYANSGIELIQHLPCNWNQKLKMAGFAILHSFTTTFFPYPLMVTISVKATLLLALIFEPASRCISNKPIIKYFGLSYGVILRK